MESFVKQQQKSSATSSGSTTVKTEGKMLPAKEDFEKSVGDEAGTSDGESEIGALKEVAKTKVFWVSFMDMGFVGRSSVSGYLDFDFKCTTAD